MHIVLCCNQGMSTSMLVKKMREAAVKNGVDVPQDYGLVRGENVLNHAIELAGK